MIDAVQATPVEYISSVVRYLRRNGSTSRVVLRLEGDALLASGWDELIVPGFLTPGPPIVRKMPAVMPEGAD